MSNCKYYQELVEKLMVGEILPEEQNELEQHSANCTECDSLLQLHQNLIALGEDIPSPDRHDLRDMREAVLEATAGTSQNTRQNTRKSSFLKDLRQLWVAHPLPSGFAAAALLAGLIFTGQLRTPNQPASIDWLQPMVQQVAHQQNGLESYWDSEFSFSNVSVRPKEDGQLALSFDASRHVDLQVDSESPLAREVLLHAIMDPSTMGSRLQAMEAIPDINDNRLQDALIYTMLNDQDPSVRLNAIAVLSNYPYDQKGQDALLQILQIDPDVQMRLTAMNELVLRDVGMETIKKTVNENNRQGDMAMLRTAALDF